VKFEVLIGTGMKNNMKSDATRPQSTGNVATFRENQLTCKHQISWNVTRSQLSNISTEYFLIFSDIFTVFLDL
jgi:hypothetical protein